MNETIRQQILAVRDGGETNMYDAYAVQRIAMRDGYYELVLYIEENRSGYARFISTGKAGGEGE